MGVVAEPAARKILLVGNPNVGKSVIFRLLTGSYVVVSNFPGTTVEISRGRMQVGGITYEVVDTPGTNSLVPQSEDERITCEILLREKPDVVIQVADAKNLRRTLLLTLQLTEFSVPLVLVLNMMDEAEERGIEIDTKGLADLFSIPLVETVAIYSKGRKQLLSAIQRARRPRNPVKSVLDSNELEESAPAALALEWLLIDDRSLIREMERRFGRPLVQTLANAQSAYQDETGKSLAREIEENRKEFLDQSVDFYRRKRQARFVEESSSLSQRIWLGLLIGGIILVAWNAIGPLFRLETPYSLAGRIFSEAFPADSPASPGVRGLIRSLLLGTSSSGHLEFGIFPELIHFLLFLAPVLVPFGVLLKRSRNFIHELGILTRKPSTGIPILLLVLFLVYEFVGYTGAQTLVGLIEKTIFGGYLVPLLRHALPGGIVSELFAGKYGLISMGLTYAIGIVLPVVGTFFIAFGLLEDSGYLPRLSILSDRVMRSMGLNGKATLPMVLGLGCVTMATMTTRILSSRKERVIATLLLALGVPCSAQLGVILGISASFTFKATLTVLGVVASQLFLVGFLSSLLVRGNRSEFIFEIPPIRVPQLRNVALKTSFRVRWYLMEAVPLFLYGTLVLFVLDKLGYNGRSLLEWIEKALEPVITGILHLPPQAAPAFVLGFLRRDYGAAGLYELVRTGALTGQQAVVSLVVITLFVPCVASFLVITKEQGLKRALAITGFIIPFAVTVGGTVGWILRTFDIRFQ